MRISNSDRSKKNIFKAGFTMLELIIVIAIMAILTTVILFSNRELNSSLLVSNTAYEINLIIHEAQVYGLGVRAAGNTSDDFKHSHGVHFDMADPTKVIIFSDRDNSTTYTPGEEVQTYTIASSRAGQILSICQPTGVGTGCRVASTILDVMFRRPNPEAIFSAAWDTGPVVINLGFTEKGFCRSILINKSGSVQINKTYCPQ